MATDLSSNWKKLQAALRQDPSNSENGKTKPKLTQRQQNSLAKRKRIAARSTNGTISSSTDLQKKISNMGSGKSAVELPKNVLPSASLASWAEDNDISAKDLAEAYGLGLKETPVHGASKDKINAGLSSNVEVGQYIAMDCEMVGVGGEEEHSALARISIVNFHGEQVYDSFVRPKEFVTDWRTHVSGVNPKDMATARPFDKVREEVAVILKGRVLVGHDIRHDMEALMFQHPKMDMRDTSKFSTFRKHSGGRTPGLKLLAREVLGVDIQEGQHSSTEDARATMLLYRQHKQAFDVEHLSRFAPRNAGSAQRKSNPQKKRKNKR